MLNQVPRIIVDDEPLMGSKSEGRRPTKRWVLLAFFGALAMLSICLAVPLIERRGRQEAEKRDQAAALRASPVFQGVGYWDELSRRAGAVPVREDDNHARLYARMSRDVRFASLAKQFCDGIGGVVYNGLVTQIPFLIDMLEREVGTPAAIAHADALRRALPYLATDESPEETEELFFKRGKGGRDVVARLDKSLEPLKDEIETDLALYFYTLKPRR